MSSHEETVWSVVPGRGARAPRAGSKHHELQSIDWFRVKKYVIFEYTDAQ